MWIVLVRKILLSLKGRISDEKNSQLSTKHFNLSISVKKKKKTKLDQKNPPSPMKLNGNAQLANRRRWSSTATLRARRLRLSARRSRRLELADRDALSSPIATLSSQIVTLWARWSRRSAHRLRRSELVDRDAADRWRRFSSPATFSSPKRVMGIFFFLLS